MKELDKFESTILSNFESITKKKEDWKDEEIVLFKEFVESSEYCAHPSLSEIQYKEIERLIGADPKKIFTSKRIARISIWLIGRGGGKGTCSTLMEEYLLYVLLHLNNVHEYFGVAEEDPMHFVNVAINSRQAGRLFDRLSQRIQNNKWFKRNYKFKIENRVVRTDERVSGEAGIIKFTNNQIIFPCNVIALSLHARNEAWADITIIFFVMDESCIASFSPIEDYITKEKHTVKGWWKLKKRFNIQSWDEKNKKIVITKPELPFSKGITKLYKVTTESGKQMVVSRRHMFYTKNGYEQLKDLIIGNGILVK